MTEQELLVDCLQRLDREYLRHWGAILRVAQTLDDLFAGKIRPKST